MELFASALMKARFWLWGAVALLAVTLLYVNRPVQFDQSIAGFFPPDHPALMDYERARQTFGSDSLIFVAYDDERLWTPQGMDRIQGLAKSIRSGVPDTIRIDSLDRMPIPWKVDSAVASLMRMAPAMRPLALPRLVAALATVESAVHSAAGQVEEIEKLRGRICAHPLFRNVLVDPQGRTTALVVQLKETNLAASVQALRSIADGFAKEHGLGPVAVVGPPVLLADGFVSLEKDNQRLGWVAMGLMSLTLFIAVRNPWWAVLPLASGGVTWLVTQAFLNAFDLRLTLSAGPIIAQTVVLCMPAASHLAMHFREKSRQAIPAGEAARLTLIAVAVPVAWCSCTAAAGYLALLSSSVCPVYQFGVTMAFCNIMAGALAYGLAAAAMQPPALFSRLSWKNRGLALPPDSPSGLEAENVSRLTWWVTAHPGRTLAMFVLPSLAITTGVSRLEFESNYIRIYRTQSRVARDYRLVEDRMGGIGLVELIFPAPREAKEITTAWLEQVHQATVSFQAVDPGLITAVLSLDDVLLRENHGDSAASSDAEDSRERRSGRPSVLGGLLSRPATAATGDQIIQTKLTILALPAFSHFIDNFWNRTAGQTRLLLRIRESAPAEQKQMAFDKLLALARQQFGPDCTITGLSHIMTQVTQAIITTQFESMGWSCGVILVMLLLALRGMKLAVLALLPTLLSVGLVLGAMGWLGIKLDISTALVASVATGLSVDDTFHCLLRWRREVRAGRSAREALRLSYASAGPGVVLSSAAVSLGFLVLVFSEFIPTANFGWLVAIGTLGGSLGNLILLPACLAVTERSP